MVKKRVTVFLNGSSANGKVLAVPDRLEVLISKSIEKLQVVASRGGPSCKATTTAAQKEDEGEDGVERSVEPRLYTANGGEIDDIDLIRDDEVLYLVPPGGHFCPPSRVQPLEEMMRMMMMMKKEEDASKKTDNTNNNNNNCNYNRSDNSSSSHQHNNMNNNIKYVSGDWISLNIGGKTFTTTRSTIVAKEPDSMLARMFDFDAGNEPSSSDDASSRSPSSHVSSLPADCRQTIVPSLMDKNGAYLIDRSPDYFEPLLGYLRHGALIIDKHLNPMGVLEEAKFYGFYSLIPELEATVLQESLLANSIERSIGLAPLTRREVVKAIIETSSDTKLRFQGVNLSGADLSKLDLSNINFKYAVLRGANLQGATLRNCIMERADMSKCNLEGAALINCHMLCANLEGSILRGSNMDSQSITELTNLEGANLNNVNLEGSQMPRVNLRIASLKNANAQNCNLDCACLAGANLENCDLSGSDLNEVNLRGANLKGTRFDLIHTPLHLWSIWPHDDETTCCSSSS